MSHLSSGPSAGHRIACCLEALESRVLLSTLTVINNADTGPGSLRQAILDANAAPGADTIAFNLPELIQLPISPASPLPEITDPLTLDGSTQPGYGRASIIHIDGSLIPGTDALVVSAGNSTIRGLDIHNFGSGSDLVLKTNGHNSMPIPAPFTAPASPEEISTAMAWMISSPPPAWAMTLTSRSSTPSPVSSSTPPSAPSSPTTPACAPVFPSRRPM